MSCYRHTDKASVWCAAVELETTGLSAGCVMGYTPSQIIRHSLDVWWENSFVSDTVGCICSPVSPQTQQASWRRPRILLWRELCVYQLWTFWLDSVKLLLPLWAEEVRPRIQLQNILPLPLHLISAFPPEKSQCSLAWYNNRVENKVRYAWLGVLPMFICSGLIFDFWNFLTVICQSLHHNFSKIVKP